MSTATNVSTAKPRVGGAVYLAPTGTTYPENAYETLANTYKNLGYISDDGVTKENERSTGEIKAWGGDVVLRPQEGYSETVKMTLIEGLNLDVLKVIFGESNVTGTLATGITINSTSEELDKVVLVVDTVLTGGVIARDVYPLAQITEIGEVSLKDAEAIGYEVTFSIFPYDGTKFHIEYKGGKASS